MKKLEGIVIVKEMIVVDGHINANNKIIAPTKEKFSAKPKAIADDYILNDPTAEIVGDAYEVFDLFEGRKRRNVVHLERAEEIESGLSIKPLKISDKPAAKIAKEPKEKQPKREPKEPKVKIEKQEEKENFSENQE